MDNGSNKNIILGVGGWIGGSLGSISLLFVGDHSFINLVFRFVGVLVAGFATGFVTVLGNDLYKLKVKPKLFPSSKTITDDTPGNQKVA